MELKPSFLGDVFGNPMEPFGQNTNIVFSILVVGDGLDDFLDSLGCLNRGFSSNPSSFPKKFE